MSGDRPTETDQKGSQDAESSGWSRRSILIGGGLAAGGVAVGAAGVGAVAAAAQDNALADIESAETAQRNVFVGDATVPFYGKHQPGIDTTPQALAQFNAYTLKSNVDRAAAVRMLKLLTDDIARMMEGTPALADTAPELAYTPARLTITIGFGPGFFDKTGTAKQKPPSLRQLPAFSKIDKLRKEYTGGDLLLQIAADDPLVLSHSARMLTKDIRSFTDIAWVQKGFLRARGVAPESQTPRNLFGQIDGTVNPAAGSMDFNRVVWSSRESQPQNPEWFDGGTMAVVRRISMDLDKWDELDRKSMEEALGRTLSNGAPLTGQKESDTPDLDKKNAVGLPVIPSFSHIRRSHATSENEQMLRRPYNYAVETTNPAGTDSGLIFTAYVGDVDKQYVPVQQRLNDGDLLNEWTTPIGSAVFAIPPGCPEGGWIGQQLLG